MSNKLYSELPSSVTLDQDNVQLDLVTIAYGDLKVRSYLLTKRPDGTIHARELFRNDVGRLLKQLAKAEPRTIEEGETVEQANALRPSTASGLYAWERPSCPHCGKPYK